MNYRIRVGYRCASCRGIVGLGMARWIDGGWRCETCEHRVKTVAPQAERRGEGE